MIGKIATRDRWHSSDAVKRLLREILAFEITAATGRRPPDAVVASWGDDATIDEDGLGFDSLSRLDAASHVTQFFHLAEVGLEDYLLVQRTLGQWVSIVERSLDTKSDNLTFRTSGSTGAPKCCQHSVRELLAEAQEFAALLAPQSRIVGLVPPLHLYGFIFTVLLPHVSRTPFFDARQAQLGLEAELADGDIVVGTPFHWALAERVVDRFADRVTAISSTGPLPIDLAERLRRKGVSRIVEIYGSSETGGLGWRGASSEPYRLLASWERSGHGVRRIGKDAAAEILALPDEVTWYGDRSLLPGLRNDGAVKIGGINVFPERVAAELLKHPTVEDCLIRRADLNEGTARLEALVVPKGHVSDEEALVRELAQFCAASLTTPERPSRFVLISEIPRSAMGKRIASAV